MVSFPTRLVVLTAIIIYLLHNIRFSLSTGDTKSIKPRRETNQTIDVAAVTAIAAVTAVAGENQCTKVLIIDDATANRDLVKGLTTTWASQSITTMQPNIEDSSTDNNETPVSSLKNLIYLSRQVRMTQSCVMVVLVSDDLEFLRSFARSSLEGRLLIWSTKLLVVTTLPLQEVHGLTSHWTFTMMNAVIMTPFWSTKLRGWRVFSHLPYTPNGPRLVELASWTPERRLLYNNNRVNLFPKKFSNFFGWDFNVTALPYKPRWMELMASDGRTLYSGTDRLMLEAMASTLNFTINLVPVNNWAEVLDLVAKRVSFMAPIIHIVIRSRLEKFDFTYTYEHGVSFGFAMKKPELKPRWERLLDPLTAEVWASILGLLVLIPFCFVLINQIYQLQRSTPGDGHVAVRSGSLVLEVFGNFLGQNLSAKLPHSNSMRILVASWLTFALIITVAYKGNLIAALAAPRYPFRPENFRELVNAVDRVTMPTYGTVFRNFLKEAESPSYRALGNILQVGVPINEGLQMVLERTQAHVDGRLHMAQKIAEHFMGSDGESRLYIGRDGIMPATNAWPIPHDAPFKPDVDSVMISVIEGGLYKKWLKDVLETSRYLGRQKRREEDQNIQLDPEGSSRVSSSPSSPKGSAKDGMALTLVHLQGPFLLLVMGLFASCLASFMEFLVWRFQDAELRK